MVISEPEVTPQGEAESRDSQSKSHHFSSIGRTSSIYSLTLDEFQHALCESGKNFGSMNMDEFLSSIWTAEENVQAVNNNIATNLNGHSNDGGGGDQPHGRMPVNEASSGGNGKGGSISRQQSITRQGSLSLPAPLCRKTVDEVWSEIHRTRQGGQQGSGIQNAESTPRQPTFGEMTLEDFLVKAGVVREQGMAPVPTPHPQHQQQQHFGMFQNAPPVGPVGFVPRPMVGIGAGGPGGVFPAAMAQVGGVMGESSGYAGNGKRGGGYGTGCYAPRVGNAAAVGGVYAGTQPIGMGGPVSPTSSDGMGSGQADSLGNDMGGGIRARKRNMDGPMDKVVERRQRRMIKNRESAARSRARKQVKILPSESRNKRFLLLYSCFECRSYVIGIYGRVGS